MHSLRLILASCCALALAACGSSSETTPDSTAASTPEQPTTSGPRSDKFPVYKATGTVEIDHGGARQKHYTVFNTVPGKPGKEVHLASWTTMADIGLPGPDDIFMSLISRPTVEPQSDQPELKIGFSLDPATLQVKPGTAVNVTLQSSDGLASDPPELANAVLTLDPVTRIDERTLALAGNVTGEMEGKPFTATFDIQTARNRSAGK